MPRWQPLSPRAGNAPVVQIPVKHFSNQVGRSTFAFNPLLQPYWRNLELYMRTDIQCGALGLTYGADYGEGYYSSANAAVLYHTMKTFPDVVTYRELADRVGYVVANAKRSELHPEIRKAGVHVQTVLDRLGSFEALNVTPDGGLPGRGRRRSDRLHEGLHPAAGALLPPVLDACAGFIA